LRHITFSHSRLIENDAIKKIADKYNKTVAQICIKYVIQRNALPLPKSTTPSRIKENADVDLKSHLRIWSTLTA